MMERDADLDSLFGDVDNNSVSGVNDSDHAGNDDLEMELLALLSEDAGPSIAAPTLPPPPMVSQPRAQLSFPSTSPPSVPFSYEGNLLITNRGAPEATRLHLPTVAPKALTRTSSAMNGRTGLTFPSLPAAHQPLPSYTTQTIPDPLGASLSRQSGHNSGYSVVSTQDFNLPSPAASAQASKEVSEREAHMEWELFQDEDVNSNSMQRRNHGGLGLDPALIPGYRYARAETRRDIRIPHRIDLHPSRFDILVPHVFFRNNTKIGCLYETLDLPLRYGKALTRKLRDYIRASPFVAQLDDRAPSRTAVKESFVKTALHILVTEGWGEKWFGRHCDSAATRKLFWPAQSTLLTFGFTSLLYNCIRNEKQHQRNLANKQKKARMSSQIEDSTAPSKEDSTGSPRENSAASPNEDSAASPRRSAAAAISLPTDGPILLTALVKHVAIIKQKQEEALAAQDPAPEEAAESAMPFTVPADANITYRVHVRDKASGVDLSVPVIYQHSSQDISNGAYNYLKWAFQFVGYPPTIYITTTNRARRIDNEVEWDNAVRDMHFYRLLAGAIVDVDVLV